MFSIYAQTIHAYNTRMYSRVVMCAVNGIWPKIVLAVQFYHKTQYKSF